MQQHLHERLMLDRILTVVQLIVLPSDVVHSRCHARYWSGRRAVHVELFACRMEEMQFD